MLMRWILLLFLAAGIPLVPVQPAHAVDVRVTLVTNPDGSLDTAYPTGNKPPTVGTLTCNDSAAPSLVGQTVGNAYSADVKQFFTGSAKGTTETYSIESVSGDDATAEGWALSGNNLTHPSSGTGSGVLRVRALYSGNYVNCSARSWSYLAVASATPTLTLVDFGSPSPASTLNQATSDVTIVGAGDRDGADDLGAFAYVQQAGDAVMSARVSSITSATDYAKAGVEVRASLSADSALFECFAMKRLSGTYSVQSRARPTTGASITTIATVSVPSAAGTRVSAVGSSWKCEYTLDGSSWVPVTDGYSLSLPSVRYWGLFGTSTSSATATPTATATVLFTNLLFDFEPDTTPPVGSGDIKWHPGHYMLLDQDWSSSRQVTHFTQIDAISANTAIKGVQLVIKWRDMETTRNNYANGIAVINAYLTKLASLTVPKHLMVRVSMSEFGTPDGQFPNSIPAYLNSSEFNGGAAIAAVGSGCGLKAMEKLWEPAVTDRLIALNQALAAQFDNNSGFEMIATAGETAVASCMNAQGYSWSGYNTQQQRLQQAQKAAWQHTQVRSYANWNGSQVLHEDVAAFNGANGITFGGPDTYAYTGDVWADRVYRGYVYRSGAWTLTGGTDYRGVNPHIAEVQRPAFRSTADGDGQGFDVNMPLSDFYNFAYTSMQMSYMLWYRNPGVGTAAHTWTNILAYINANPNMARTTCPTAFASCLTD